MDSLIQAVLESLHPHHVKRGVEIGADLATISNRPHRIHNRPTPLSPPRSPSGLARIAPEFDTGMEDLYTKEGDGWVNSQDLGKITAQLDLSAGQIAKAMEPLLQNPKKVGPYSHPLFFMQHMLWHEGWHISSIMQALRANGKELDEDWEEAKIWAIWRS